MISTLESGYSKLLRRYIDENGDPTFIDSDMHMPIPLSSVNFYSYLYKINKLFPLAGKKFIDIGTGIGCKTLIASELFEMKATGLEYSPIIIEHSIPNILMLRGDGRKFNYKEYDLIYMYEPMIGPKNMMEMLTNIVNTMHSNALLLYINLTLRIDELKSLEDKCFFITDRWGSMIFGSPNRDLISKISMSQEFTN